MLLQKIEVIDVICMKNFTSQMYIKIKMAETDALFSFLKLNETKEYVSDERQKEQNAHFRHMTILKSVSYNVRLCFSSPQDQC